MIVIIIIIMIIMIIQANAHDRLDDTTDSKSVGLEKI